METTPKKKNAVMPSTIEQAAGEGPMMEFNGVRSDKDVKFMSEWVAKRKAELTARNSSNQ